MSELSASINVQKDITKKTGSISVTILENTARPGFSVIRIAGHRDDDTSQGSYHDEQVIEMYESEETAQRRAQELDCTDGYESENTSGGEFTAVMSYRYYKTGAAVLHLCLVEEERLDGTSALQGDKRE